MSQKIREGNDIDITWSLYDADENPYIVTGRDVSIELNVGTKRVKISEFSLSGNQVHFVYRGKDQKHLGSYALKYIENAGENDMVTFDTEDAFTLVAHSWLAVDEGETPETIQIEVVTIGSVLLEKMGPRGYSAYEIAVQNGFVGTVEEWLESLKGEPGTTDYNELENKPDLSQFITKSVDDLVYYYLKSETYTKAEVEALIGAINQFHYEIYASTSEVTNPQSNVLYLIGPTGSGADKYEEYVYSNSTWVKIGDTSIDLSGYVTTQALNTALANYTTSADLATLLAGKQDTISDLSTIRSGASAGATAYQKPNTGIPKTDLAEGVQASLDKADTALQEHQDISGKANKSEMSVSESGDKTTITLKSGLSAEVINQHQSLTHITDLIPGQASPENQLADKEFVNSSIETNTASFKGTYNLVSDLSLTISATASQIATALGTSISGADNNDYAFVQIPTADATPSQIARVDRFKYNGTAWAYEWSLNNSSFTAAQWAALNSGITSQKVTKLDALPSASELQTSLGAKVNATDIVDNLTTNDATKVLSAKQGKVLDGKVSQLGQKVNTFQSTPDNDHYPSEKLVYDSLTLKEDASNKVTSLSSASTDNQYPSAKCVYDALYENAIISLTVNSAGTASDLIGLKVTVTNTDTSEQISEQTWNGTPLVVRIKAGVNYTVSVQNHPDYVTPVAQSFKSELASTRAIVFEYIYSTVIDLSYRDTDGQVLQSQNTANSYIARVAGDYKFPAVYGNAIKNGATNADSYTRQGSTYTADFVNYKGVQITSPYIETDTSESIASAVLLWQTGANLISNVSFADGYVSFTVNSIPTENGLTVLAVKDANGDIMWSWTIWLTTDTLTAETFTNHTEVDYDLMPETLFSIWNDGRTYCVCPHFQWGRKDAMVPASLTSGSSNMTVYDISGNAISWASSATLGSSVIGVFGTDQDESSDKTVANAIKNPGIFFTRYNTTTNNWNNLSYFYNFWNAHMTDTSGQPADDQDSAVKTIYDPCPVGFMLPAGRAFTGFTTTGSNTSTAEEFNVVGSFSAGWKFKANDEDSDGQFFPASGSRHLSSGGVGNVSNRGYCWSSAAYSALYAYYLGFSSGYVYPINYDNRAYGFSVRPCRESE